MANSNQQKQSSFVFRISSIKSIYQLGSALKHNNREIQAEHGAFGHIDPKLMKANYSLLEKHSSSHTLSLVKKSISTFQTNVGRRIRSDAVLALEVLFSLPIHRLDIDQKSYFEECLKWGSRVFQPAEIISAEVHLDEAHPHMHLIFFCVTATQLVGNGLRGNKQKYAARQNDFHTSVAQKFGLSIPTTKMNKADRLRLGERITSHFEKTNDPATKSPCYPIVKALIIENPIEFAEIYGISISSTPKKMKTMAQIFTSKGKGPKWEKDDEHLPV
jgi:hypothetical protein